jgi:hypothetical protein
MISEVRLNHASSAGTARNGFEFAFLRAVIQSITPEHRKQRDGPIDSARSMAGQPGLELRFDRKLHHLLASHKRRSASIRER